MSRPYNGTLPPVGFEERATVSQLKHPPTAAMRCNARLLAGLRPSSLTASGLIVEGRSSPVSDGRRTTLCRRCALLQAVAQERPMHYHARSGGARRRVTSVVYPNLIRSTCAEEIESTAPSAANAATHCRTGSPSCRPLRLEARLLARAYDVFPLVCPMRLLRRARLRVRVSLLIVVLRHMRSDVVLATGSGRTRRC
jgi:hypothetical protein